MAYDEDLADRIRLLLGDHHLTEKKMFGGLAFLLDGHMALVVSGQDGIMVRCDPTETATLVAQPDAGPMVMQGRPLKGWLRVDGPTLDDDAVLRQWADRGVSYAATLPPK